MKVTALEFQRGFGRVRVMAQRAPVVITHHGRDDLVLLSADDYAKLKSGVDAAPDTQVIEPGTLSIARAFKTLVEQQWNVERVVLFGSRARGDHRTDSDIDVAVILRGKKGDHVSTLLQMNALAYDLSLEAGVSLQPVPVWETEWADPDSHENPALIRNMQKDAVLVRILSLSSLRPGAPLRLPPPCLKPEMLMAPATEPTTACSTVRKPPFLVSGRCDRRTCPGLTTV